MTMMSIKRSKRNYAKTNETAEIFDETTYNAPTEETFIQEQVRSKLMLSKVFCCYL